MAVGAEGNAFVAGVAFGMAGDQDYVVIKYSSAGVGLWTNRYNGPGNGNDGANAVAVDGNGNVIVTGLSIGISGLSSYFDYATVKYSGAGVPLWTNRYNGPANNDDQATDVVVDRSGNVFVTGYSFTSDGRSDYLTIAYSSAGMPLWTNHYNGGFTYDARAVVVDSGGNAIVTGQSHRDSQTSDIVTAAYSNGGVPLWTNRYNGPANGDDVPLSKRSLALGSNGSVYVTAASDGDFSDERIVDFVTVKYAVPGPSLFIARSNSSVILSRSVTALNFQLQDNTNLLLANGRSAVGAPSSTNNGFVSVTGPAGGSGKFFRLSSQ